MSKLITERSFVTEILKENASHCVYDHEIIGLYLKIYVKKNSINSYKSPKTKADYTIEFRTFFTDLTNKLSILDSKEAQELYLANVLNKLTKEYNELNRSCGDMYL